MKTLEHLRATLVNAFENIMDEIDYSDPKTEIESRLRTLRCEIKGMNEASRQNKINTIQVTKMLPEVDEASKIAKVAMKIDQVDRLFSINITSDDTFRADLLKLQLAYTAEFSVRRNCSQILEAQPL